MRGRTADAVACAWGFAEATLFFIVPDVWLTFLALLGLRLALVAAAWSLVGALAGGLVMLVLGVQAPGAALRLLDAVPAISPELIARVRAQVDAHGAAAVVLGPIGGVPYKIYAVDWGARHASWLAFLLVSIPARGVRFFLAPVIVAGIQRWIVRRRRVAGLALLAAFWLGFYTFYFARFRG